MAITEDRWWDAMALRLAPHGLQILGAFHPAPEDAAPERTGTLALIGNAGPELWRAFARDRRDEPNPLDNWTRRTIDPVAAAFGAHPLYPFAGPPYPPIQRWAQRAGAAFPSPLGLLVHPLFGLWHAYRAALTFRAVLDLPDRPPAASPCESCAEKPCLAACPVGAFTPGGYDTAACRDHLATPAGDDCMGDGCRARRACPVGQDYRYAPDQARFHMTRFRESDLR